MPNIKSQKKRVKTDEIRRQRNVNAQSRMKTYVKRAEDSMATKSSDEITPNLLKAVSEIDKACSKGLLHRNSAARKKASLARQFKEATS